MPNGEKLKKKLEKSELTQKEFAEKIKTTPEYVSAMVNGKVTNSTERILKNISEALNCTIDEII